MSKKDNGFGDNSSRHLHIRFRNDVIGIIKDRAKKQNVTISEYCRDLVQSALIKDSDMTTSIHIVGFNHSDNDKVIKATKPATYRKVNFKNRRI